ncbi:MULTISPECIES: helix-turn-helix domain-containing protein [unclassified Streptomyces]|uniref:helix-turn-helix domain-containing protein n=1 Tax=unclassified Streptomyces TaxID=2593676 RepID=UPI0038220BC2
MLPNSPHVAETSPSPAPDGLLGALGIPEPEERVYLRVLARPGRSTDSIAAELTLGAESAAETLELLAERGLVRRQGVPPAWSATAPDVAVEALLLRREEELCRTRGRIGELMRTYHRARPPSAAGLVEMVTGRTAIAERWRSMQEGARSSVLLFDKAPHIMRADPGAELPLLARGVRMRVVYEASTVRAPGRLAELRDFIEAGEEARMLPELPCKLAVVDDRWAMLPVSNGAELRGALFVRPSSLLDALVAMFEVYWHRGLRVPDADDPGRVAGDRRREVLTLLSAGLTDDSIARQLGVSPRTVQRWVHEVMDMLGARTRFQAGIQAARAGLL